MYWGDEVFEINLIKSQEINLDYILEQIFEKKSRIKDKVALVDDIRPLIRASPGNRAKEQPLVDFIEQTDPETLSDKASLIKAFFCYAQAQQRREAEALIAAESLDAAAAKRYIFRSIQRGHASEIGTELHDRLQPMSSLNPKYQSRKRAVCEKNFRFRGEVQGHRRSLLAQEPPTQSKGSARSYNDLADLKPQGVRPPNPEQPASWPDLGLCCRGYRVPRCGGRCGWR